MKYTQRMKPVTRRNDNQVIACPICGEHIEIVESGSYYRHLAQSHEELIDKVIQLFSISENVGYDLSMLKCERDTLASERFWRS